MSLRRTLATRCERLVNRLVEESTPARRVAGELEGRSMAVEIVGLDLTVRAAVTAGAVAIALDSEEAADVTIRAAPLELARLAAAGSTDELKARRTQLEGDVHVAERFAELARLARPDIEDELSRWIGDIAAHEAAGMARRLGAFAARARRALELDTAEYLHEEQRLLPGPLEVDAFCADVDELRDAVERAAARLGRLESARARTR